jgi:class I fructose-bisphosphate aldolase
MIEKIRRLLGDEAEQLLGYRCLVAAENLYLPGPDFVGRVMTGSDRKPTVMRNMQALFGHGRLAGTGYLSILPVDHGVEHGAGAAFAPNPDYFDPENIARLVVESGASGLASGVGVLGSIARRYAHRVPMILKLNHNQLLTYPNRHEQIMFGGIDQAFDMGALAVGATVYFGSDESGRQIEQVAEAFRYAHQLGMVTLLWAYLRNDSLAGEGSFKTAADLTGQANYLSAAMQADIIKQKMPTSDRGFVRFEFGRTHQKVYTELTSDNPIDLVRYQVMNCHMGRSGLINSGGASRGREDLAEAVRAAVINKRAGGMGIIAGRKAFQRPVKDGIELLHTIQNVYLCQEVSIA